MAQYLSLLKGGIGSLDNSVPIAAAVPVLGRNPKGKICQLA